MENPILDSLLEGLSLENDESTAGDGKYAEGTWDDAVLLEAEYLEGTFGPQIALRVNLTGDEENAKPFTVFCDLPIKPEANGEEPDERVIKRYTMNLNKLKSYIHAAGIFVKFNEKGKAIRPFSWAPEFNSLDTEERVNRILNVFQSVQGGSLPIKIKYREYTNKDGEKKLAKDVWGRNPKMRQ